MEVWFTIQKLFYMKDFIPYEEALELKQLRFDEPCFTWYWDDIGMYNGLELGNHNKHINYISAPTFSQAFRFFREKYKLVHEIHENEKQFIDYVASKGGHLPTYIYGYSSNGCYHRISTTYIYEEAELACLRKLIEIVKQKR
jgi:hypothetical protein